MAPALSYSLGLNAILATVCVVMLLTQQSTHVSSAMSARSTRMTSPMMTRQTLPNRVCRQAGNILRGRDLRVGAEYTVKLKTPTGEHEIVCPDNMYILDKAEQEGIALPFSCRAGFCISCAGIMEDGTVDQSDQTFLNEKQINDGIVLTCYARPTSDMTVRTHVENELNL
mmetsp:Transcript_19499/g.36706  ORF Transcript_19499/g.36706 Transcript_19499/m.36706 type:complete len:170 (-) Transcript_19499:183-692(-)|eukprot:CAMPEP_0170171258 /NCGR_PEP_ID=MMETSP0040_2-20121228/4385_1 /TAXON_ID=641309 /ORGANISM="Lotharella oceanica, Strain CCMP622" /LENGTH=169 /DNA_ID=CAMNT_0010411203 /DNA_START=35 /DNA_END=544 /DNA_ORIENTATION=+